MHSIFNFKSVTGLVATASMRLSVFCADVPYVAPWGDDDRGTSSVPAVDPCIDGRESRYRR